MILTPSTPALDSSLVKKAISALVNHHEKTKPSNDLLESSEPLHVQIGLESASKRSYAKPFQIRVPHSIHKEDEAEICMFVKQSDVPELTKIYEGTVVKKVMGLETLRKDYAEFAQRRRLMKTYSVFLADDRIITMIPDVLGRDAWNRPPLPVRVMQASSIRRAVYESTYLSVTRGTCILVRAGDLSQSLEDLVENVSAIVQEGKSKLGQRGLRFQSVSVKLPTSAALPILNVLPTEFVQKKTPKSNEVVVRKDHVKANGEGLEPIVASKSKKPSKSPLLNALKKQKSDDIETPDTVRKRKVESPLESEITDAPEQPVKKTKAEKKKAKGEEKRSDEANVNSAEKSKAKKKEKKAKKSRKEESENKGEVGAKSKGEEPRLKAPEETLTAPFVVSKKYSGSKEGYVFKKGESGLGYYVDMKPVADKMAMDALFRMSSGGKRKKTSKRRR